jgi:hypothetical protein
MFECGRVSAAELTEWARLIERRDDIDAEDFGNGTRDWVLSAIFLLSNPELVGDSIPALIEAILNEYKRVLQ